jgi:hypothetical protein
LAATDHARADLRDIKAINEIPVVHDINLLPQHKTQFSGRSLQELAISIPTRHPPALEVAWERSIVSGSCHDSADKWVYLSRGAPNGVRGQSECGSGKITCNIIVRIAFLV